MADYLIKNIEIPKNPSSYISVGYDRQGKMLVTESIWDGRDWRVERHENTVTELPAHYGLKDFGDILRIFDKVIHDVDDDTCALLCDLIAQIQAAPTIVEATREGKGIPATS